MKDGIDPMVDPFNIPKTYPDIHGKRKKESIGEGSSRPQKKKVVVFLDEDEAPLSERQKTMLLKDTSEVVQHSSRASDIASSKLPTATTPITFDYVISKSILPIQPPPSSQPIIYEPILLPPPSKSSTINPTTETPLVSEPLSQQQQIPSPPSPSQLQISATPPPCVYTIQPTNPNIATPKTSPSRISDGHVSDGTPEGTFNFEPKPISSDQESPPIIFHHFHQSMVLN